MDFYYHDVSPPSQAVWMVLNELGIKYEAKEIDLLKGQQQSKEYKAINPFGKVPAIKDGDFCLSESRAIGVYLCVAYEPKDKAKQLYPTDPKEMAVVNMMLNIDSSIYGKIYDYANIGKMFRKEELDANKLEGVHSSLATLENILGKSTFLAAEHHTLADIFVLSTVKMLDLTSFTDWEKYPNLKRWKSTMESLAHYEESIGKHVRKWAAALKQK